MSIPNNSFGYEQGPLSLPIIARFDPIKNSWTHLGKLKVARYGHSVIQVDNTFIAVGGQQATGYIGNFLSTESCKLKGQEMVCTTREPQLEGVKSTEYPELILMP